MAETATDQQAEITALRERVAALERELAERTERANAAVAAAEDRALLARPLARRPERA